MSFSQCTISMQTDVIVGNVKWFSLYKAFYKGMGVSLTGCWPPCVSVVATNDHQ